MVSDMSFVGPDARPLVDGLLRRALGSGASDIHLEPTGAGMEVRLRVDGLLERVETLSAEVGRRRFCG